jgi:hypothetical protein
MFQFIMNLLLQFLLFVLAEAAPISTENHGNAWRYGASGGVVGFIVLVLDIIVFSTYFGTNPLLDCIVIAGTE